MGSSGVVSTWSDDEGWGVIDSVETPGGCWVHFSAIGGDSDGARSLTVGHSVEFAWEWADQDGFRYRATSVDPSPGHRRRAQHDGETSSAYGSTLTLEYDGGDAG